MNIVSKIPQELVQEIDYQANSTISKVLVKLENLNVTLFAVAVGQEFSPHTTSRQALVHILEGAGDFMLDDKWHRVKAGEYFYMPKNLLHAIRAKENFKFLLYLFP